MSRILYTTRIAEDKHFERQIYQYYYIRVVFSMSTRISLLKFLVHCYYTYTVVETITSTLTMAQYNNAV